MMEWRRGLSFRRWILTGGLPVDLLLLSDLKPNGEALLIKHTPGQQSGISWSQPREPLINPTRSFSALSILSYQSIIALLSNCTTSAATFHPSGERPHLFAECRGWMHVIREKLERVSVDNAKQVWFTAPVQPWMSSFWSGFFLAFLYPNQRVQVALLQWKKNSKIH